MIPLYVLHPSQTFHIFYGECYIVGYFGQIQQYSFVLITPASYCCDHLTVGGDGDINCGILDEFINTSSSCLKCNKFSCEWSCFRPLASFVCIKKLEEKVSRSTDKLMCCKYNNCSFCFDKIWTGRAHNSLKLADFIYYVFIQMEWAV